LRLLDIKYYLCEGRGMGHEGEEMT
jgi:hypothetical protein